jgi:hypothetical protein
VNSNGVIAFCFLLLQLCCETDDNRNQLCLNQQATYLLTYLLACGSLQMQHPLKESRLYVLKSLQILEHMMKRHRYTSPYLVGHVQILVGQA